ncbi:alpha/beta fold hydrolase [Clostridium sp.]|uniref:alpha/beta fold hydrolase n=1 Tax=Clostridium sp. TaxID=1506 RepID=UPI003464DA11
MKKIISIILVLIIGVLGAKTLISESKGDNKGGETVENYVAYEGVNLYTKTYNYSDKTKEAIIYLHGLGGSSQSGEFLNNPSNPYMTITMDMLNHGNSGKIDSITWDNHLDSIKAVLDYYNVKKAYIVGHSFGADTAMMFQEKYPKISKRVILLDRAHYNFKDLEQFNMDRKLFEILEYNPLTGLTFDDFSKFMDLSYNNDIEETYDTKNKTLFIGSDPKHYFGDPDAKVPSLSQVVSMIKSNPEALGLTKEAVKDLKDVSEEDLKKYSEFILKKMDNLSAVNKNIKVIKTPYKHTMVIDPEAKEEVLKYIIDFI